MRRRALLLPVLFVLAASRSPVASAQSAGSIGVFADPSAAVCDIADSGQGLFSLYVLHVNTAGAISSQFRVQPSTGMNLTYVAESVFFSLVVGNTRSGIWIQYGSCESGPILLAALQYFADGTSAPCSYLEIVPDPAAPTGMVETVDCTPEKYTLARGGRAMINSDGGCDCDVATEPATWSRVKALYR